MKDWHRKIWKPIAGPLWMVCDPVTKACKPALVRHWDKKYKHHGHLAPAVLIFDLVLLSFLGMVVVGGIFAYFVLPAFPKPGLVRLEVAAPTATVSGRDAVFTVSYKNETPGTLGCAMVKVDLPEHFDLKWSEEVLSGPPCAGKPLEQAFAMESEGVDIHHLGDIISGQEGKVTVAGTLYGRPGDTQMARAELIFWEEGQASPTRVISRAEWTISDSIVDLAIEPGRNLVRGRQSPVIITYKIEEAIDALVITLDPPADLRITGSVPPQTGRNEWRSGPLAAGTEGSITLNGYLRTSGQAASVFTARAADGKGHLLNEVRVNADARTTGFELSQDMTAALTPTLLPSLEETVTVTYRNGGEHTLKDLRIYLDPELSVIEAPSPSDLQWSLDKVEPGGSGEFSATFRIRSDFGDLAKGSHPALTIAARAEYVLEDDPAVLVLADTPPQTIPISSLLRVKAAGFYYTSDGEQLGVGPLPPKVGQVTKYRVVVYVTNTTNDVEDAWFEAYLPQNVDWTGRYSVTAGESMDYFASTGRVRWKIGTVPAYEDGTGERIGASFEVALTPGAEDAGTTPLLVRGIEVTGVDAVTRARLGADAGDITTALVFDIRAEGKGQVTE